ncbi:MAG TPA: YihY/virulence factor BrkB family protein [Bryobacteraceae bacterium]|jgi:membrane protein|nr:YihY/virulence factor BrkB family protein [Bryobacteraceae bacterium]
MPGIFRALRPTFLYWMKTEVHVYAFSIAANVLLSFYPFLIVSVAVASKFFNRATALSAIDLALNDFFPDALGNFLHNNPPPQGKIEIISLFLLLFTANGIFEPLEVGLNHVWGIHKNRSFLRNQVVSLALIFLCGGLALGSLLMTAFTQESFRQLTGLSPAWLPHSVFAAIPLLTFKVAAASGTVFVLFLIYRFLPNGRPPLERVIPAAIVVGVLLEVLKHINRWVWPGFYQKLGREYNVFKNSVTLILIGFLVSMLVLAGAEWSARGHRMDEVEKANA